MSVDVPGSSAETFMRVLLGLLLFITVHQTKTLCAQSTGQDGPAPTQGDAVRTQGPQFSIGLLAGPTSGLSFKALFREAVPEAPGRSTDLHLSLNAEGFVQIAGHSLKERTFPDAPMTLYLGPGMITELEDGSLRWGLSGMMGAYFVKGPYEVLLQLMPRLLLTPERHGGYSAAIGLRFRL